MLLGGLAGGEASNSPAPPLHCAGGLVPGLCHQVVRGSFLPEKSLKLQQLAREPRAAFPPLLVWLLLLFNSSWGTVDPAYEFSEAPATVRLGLAWAAPLIWWHAPSL